MFVPIGYFAAVGDNIITDNLALYLDFKDGQSYPGTGTSVTDLSTNGFTLTGRNYNSGTLTDSALSYQNNLYIDLGDGGTQSNSDFIEMANNTTILPESGDYTMQHWIHLDNLWVYTQPLAEFMSCIFEGTELVFTMVRNFISTGYPEIRWVVRDASNNISSNNIKLDDYVNANEWFMFTGTIDRTNNEQKVYINDTLVATGTVTFTDTIAPSTDYAFGARPDTTGANDVGLFHGFVGKNMIYKGKALTQAEVTQNYNATKDDYIQTPIEIVTTNLEQWMDVVGSGGSESTALTDKSGYGRNLTNSGLTWDGTNSWFYVSGNSDWTKHIDTGYTLSNFGGSYDWTLECWVNMETLVGGSTALIHNRSSTYGNNFITVGTNASYYGESVIIDTVSNEAGIDTGESQQNTWVLLTATNNGSTNTMKIFINGVEKVSTSTSAVVNVNRAESLSLYGNYLRNIRWIQDAKFGSYRIYSAAHTATEALQNYNAEKSHFGL